MSSCFVQLQKSVWKIFSSKYQNFSNGTNASTKVEIFRINWSKSCTTCTQIVWFCPASLAVVGVYRTGDNSVDTARIEQCNRLFLSPAADDRYSTPSLLSAKPASFHRLPARNEECVLGWSVMWRPVLGGKCCSVESMERACVYVHVQEWRFMLIEWILVLFLVARPALLVTRHHTIDLRKCRFMSCCVDVCAGFHTDSAVSNARCSAPGERRWGMKGLAGREKLNYEALARRNVVASRDLIQCFSPWLSKTRTV